MSDALSHMHQQMLINELTSIFERRCTEAFQSVSADLPAVFERVVSDAFNSRNLNSIIYKALHNATARLEDRVIDKLMAFTADAASMCSSVNRGGSGRGAGQAAEEDKREQLLAHATTQGGEMITDPTKLFEALARCMDENNRPTDLPAATTAAIYELLEDDQLDETDEIRGMNAIAAARLLVLGAIVHDMWPMALLLSSTDKKLAVKMETLIRVGGIPL